MPNNLPCLTTSEKRELIGLISLAREQQCNAAQSARLQELVRGRADGPTQSLRMSQMAADIGWFYDPRAERVREQVAAFLAEKCCGDSTEAPSAAPAAVPRVLEKQPTVALAQPFDAPSSSLGLFELLSARISSPLMWSIMGVGTLFAAYFIAISWGIISKRLDHSQLAATDRKSEILEDRSQILPVATLTYVEGCQWQIHGQPVSLRQGTKLLAKDKLSLISGTAEIAFADGANVVLEGPATFEVESPGRGKLDRGKLVAKVPQRAIGFIINTPTAEIIDLGTEFGVEVDEAGEADVHVFEGLVVAEVPASANSAPQRLELRKSESARIRNFQERISKKAVEPERFQRKVSRVVASPQSLQIVASHDTYLLENSGNTNANQDLLYLRSSAKTTVNVQLHLLYLQFELSSLSHDIATASLNLTATQDHNYSFKVHYFGAYEREAGFWDEGLVTWNKVAILFRDNDNLKTEIEQGNFLLDQWDLVPSGDQDSSRAKVVLLGSESFSPKKHQTLSFRSQELVGFINQARAKGDATVTIVVAVEPDQAILLNLFNKEAKLDGQPIPINFKPHLEVTLVPANRKTNPPENSTLQAEGGEKKQ